MLAKIDFESTSAHYDAKVGNVQILKNREKFKFNQAKRFCSRLFKIDFKGIVYAAYKNQESRKE